jgi:hypothetical protein
LNDRLIVVRETTERLREPTSFVYQRTRLDAMPGMVRIGKYIRNSETALEAFIEGRGEMNTNR